MGVIKGDTRSLDYSPFQKLFKIGVSQRGPNNKD